MPLRTDNSGKRWVEMDLALAAAPDQVWRALATGPGVTAWFTPAVIDEAVGGAITFDFGGHGTSTGEVTVWDPPRRFAYVERDWAEGAPPVVTDITITPRPDGGATMRMAHEIETGDTAFDSQLEGFERGWVGFFHVLQLYLANFADSPAASGSAMATVARPQSAVWPELAEALGLAGAGVGDVVKLAGPGAWRVEVERIAQDRYQRSVLLRIDAEPAGVCIFGTYEYQGATIASLALYRYGARADAIAAADQTAWRDWFSQTFPGADSASS